MSENKIKYRQCGDYLLPELKKTPASPYVGVWGKRRRYYAARRRAE